MDTIALARTVIEAGNVSGDWQPLIDHLADDVVFKLTVPDGTPISGEVRGKEAVVQHFANLGNFLGFSQEKPIEYFGNGDRVIVLGRESVEIKKSGVTVPGSDYVTVLDFRGDRITLFLVIQDMSEFTAAYRTG